MPFELKRYNVTIESGESYSIVAKTNAQARQKFMAQYVPNGMGALIRVVSVRLA